MSRLLADASLKVSVVLLLVAVLGFLPVESSALQEMTSSEMSSVTGHGGLSVDINLNTDIGSLRINDYDETANGGNGATNGRIIFQNISLNNGSGGAASLTGATLDIDDNEGLVFGAPNGNFTASVFDICPEDDFNDFDCDSQTSGDDSFFEITADQTSIANSEFRVNGSGDGLTADVDLNLTINSLRFDDADGAGSAGAIELQNLQIGDRSSANPVTLSGFTLDADATNGLEVGLPSGNFDIAADDVMLPASGSSLGEVFLENLNLNTSELEIVGSNGGVSIDGQAHITSDEFRIIDSNGGSAGSAGKLAMRGIEFHDGSNSPVSISGMPVNIRPNGPVAVGLDGFSSFDLDIDDLVLGHDGGSGNNIGLSLTGFSPHNVIMTINGNNQGLTIGFEEFDFDVNSSSGIDLTDPDGLTGSGSAGTVRLGAGTTEIGQDGPDQIGNLTIDADGNSGLVIGPPSSGNVTFLLEDNKLTSRGNSMGGLFFRNISFQSDSEIGVQGTSDGVELETQLLGASLDFSIEDDDGWGGAATSSGGVIASPGTTIEISDGSGNAGRFTLDADGQEGMQIEAFDDPNNNVVVGFSSNTVFLGANHNNDASFPNNPSPVQGTLQVTGSGVDVFTR